MVSREENSSLVDWFLNLDPFTYPPYGIELIQEGDDELRHHTRGYEDQRHVDNDDIISRTLQDSFVQLEISENNDHSNHIYTNSYNSNNKYGWNDQYFEYSPSSEGDGRSEDFVNQLFSSSRSDTDEYVYSWESDQCDSDGEFGKRLNQMVPIPYIPKINGDIPTEREAVSDHERLRNRLEMYDFAEVKILGDGNCQFRALAEQLYKTADRHKHVREQIVKQLKSRRDLYEGYVPMNFSAYLKKMSRNGEWGDHVTLQAASDAYRVKIVILTSYKDTCYIEIVPTSQQHKLGVIFLSFWAEVHYNSIYLNQELQRKKKWWRFRN